VVNAQQEEILAMKTDLEAIKKRLEAIGHKQGGLTAYGGHLKRTSWRGA